ncbi:hypothetical protein ETAA8_45840 [Anatilimnocola aggregata]|uniref:Uncharacterized protein n=1 Tax=Anatilimnocola aggregata TaxID=2528021 RepID=A0A517YGW0_9BACT|nr:hypothetical protein [Anatilimnocola aggregata]QDU29474.1 hypothetical protein ETAA8_45840 [Anatilimnocola aggregata]
MTRQALQQVFDEQRLANGYELVDGVAMHAENGKRFQIPHPVLKKHIDIGQFVELRIDSPRFSVHEDAPEKCTCPTCNGEITKPILSHEHPATLLPLPIQNVPSRGWGEDFWVRIIERAGDFFRGIVDNPLYETRLHELNQGGEIVFHQDHILAVHGIHRHELITGMNAADLKELAQWLGSQPD